LPRDFRDYIHDIETRGDPQFQIRELNECRLQREQLIKKIEELKEENERLRNERSTSNTKKS
jgi:cell shape-determining protein MreC